MGWIGFLLVGGGVISVWAGFQGVKITDVLAGILQGKPIAPTTNGTHATAGAAGASGLPAADGTPTGSAGGGVSGGSGGGW